MKAQNILILFLRKKKIKKKKWSLCCFRLVGKSKIYSQYCNISSELQNFILYLSPLSLSLSLSSNCKQETVHTLHTQTHPAKRKPKHNQFVLTFYSWCFRNLRFFFRISEKKKEFLCFLCSPVSLTQPTELFAAILQSPFPHFPRNFASLDIIVFCLVLFGTCLYGTVLKF